MVENYMPSRQSLALLKAPPDGVELAALGLEGEKLKSPDECEQLYQEAFEAAGGEKSMQEALPLASRLQAELSGPASTVTQMEAWQAYPLPFVMDRMGQKSRIVAYGQRCFRALEADLHESVDPGIVLQMGGTKGFERSSVKTRIKYAMDCSRLCDLNRATLVCPSIGVLYAAAERFFELWGPAAGRESTRIVEWGDHYQSPMPGGYRHLQALVRLGGAVWELQLTTTPMMEAKHKAGHKLYKTTRFVKEMILFTAMEGDIEALEKLLRHPGIQDVADPNAVRDKSGLSALHYAAFRGDLEVFRLLRDPGKVSEPADLWASDCTALGGLPLNYAVRLRHWEMAQALAEAMLEVPRAGITAAVRSQLSAACAVAVDAFDEAPDLLPALMDVWKATGQDPSWEGISPLDYAVSVKAEPPLAIVLQHTDLWETDRNGRLPIEKVVRKDLRDTAVAVAKQMPESMPLMPSSDAAWSLSRCRSMDIPDLNALLAMVKQQKTQRIYTSGTSGSVRALRQHGAMDFERVGNLESELAFCCFAPCDDSVYAGSMTGEIHQFDLDEERSTRILKGHKQQVSCLLLGPEGRKKPTRLYSGCVDETVRIWLLSTGECAVTLTHGEDVTTMALSGTSLITGGGVRLHIWKVGKIGKMTKPSRMRGGELRGCTGAVESVLVSRDRVFAGGVGGQICVWSAEAVSDPGPSNSTPAEIWRKGHSRGFRISCLARGLHGQLFSAANVCEREGAESKAWRRQRRGPSEVRAWSPTGELLSSWTGDFLFFILGISVTPEGSLFAADTCGWLRMWDAETAAQIAVVRAHDDDLFGFALGRAVDDGDLVSPAESTKSSSDDGEALARPLSPSSAKRRAAIKRQFRAGDSNGDGRLNLAELKGLLRQGKKEIADAVVEMLFKAMDRDSSGTVFFDEFVDFVFTKGNPIDVARRGISTTVRKSTSRTRTLSPGRGIS